VTEVTPHEGATFRLLYTCERSPRDIEYFDIVVVVPSSRITKLDKSMIDKICLLTVTKAIDNDIIIEQSGTSTSETSNLPLFSYNDEIDLENALEHANLPKKYCDLCDSHQFARWHDDKLEHNSNAVLRRAQMLGIQTRITREDVMRSGGPMPLSCLPEIIQSGTERNSYIHNIDGDDKGETPKHAIKTQEIKVSSTTKQGKVEDVSKKRKSEQPISESATNSAKAESLAKLAKRQSADEEPLDKASEERLNRLRNFHDMLMRKSFTKK